jgi:hypothetical protein
MRGVARVDLTSLVGSEGFGMSAGVKQWERVVWGARQIPDSTRVYLLYLARQMTADHQVSVPRAEIARALGVSERRIDDRNSSAIAAGFLTVVQRGRRGRVAVYQGILPTTGQPSREWTPQDLATIHKRALVAVALSASERTLVDVARSEDPPSAIARPPGVAPNRHGCGSSPTDRDVETDAEAAGDRPQLRVVQ